MENPSCTSLKTLFFAALMLPLLCSAAAVDDTALKYLTPGEAGSATITNFTSGGSTYYMVFGNQAELFLLKADSQGFSIVSDRPALTTPLKDYIALKYDAAVTSDTVTSIKSEYAQLYNSSKVCTKSMNDLLLNPYQMNLVWENGDYTGNTYRAVMRLNGQNGSKGISIPGISNVSMLQNKSNINKALVRGYLAVIVGGMNYLGEMSSGLSENATIADNTIVMTQMAAFITEFKTPLAQYVSDHNFMNKFYSGVLPKACTFNATSFAKMDSLLVVKTLPSETQLADNLSKSAADRSSRLAASGTINELAAAEKTSADALGADAATVRQTLAQYGISTNGLDSRLSEVNASLLRTKNSVTATEAQSLHADFEAKLESANTLIALLKQESTVAALASADAALAQSQAAIGLASARMGENDTNANNLNQTWAATSVELASAKAQLATGKAEAVEAIANATAKLNSVKVTAEGLTPVSGQTDILIIGLFILIIIAGIVAFFYTRNQKKEPPVEIAAGPGTPGLKKGTSGIIVERK